MDTHRYILNDGLVKVKDKMYAGTYEGFNKVNKIPRGSFENMVSLHPENIAVLEAKDAAGQPVSFTTSIAPIEDLKGKSRSTVTTQKFGTALLGNGSYYAFLKSNTREK